MKIAHPPSDMLNSINEDNCSDRIKKCKPYSWSFTSLMWKMRKVSENYFIARYVTSRTINVIPRVSIVQNGTRQKSAIKPSLVNCNL